MPYVQANDATLHYEILGEGEPILFLHGSGVCWRFWEPQFEAFSKLYQMILVDLRGHGESSKEFPNGQYDHQVIADDMRPLLDHLGLERVHVVGCSQGAQVGTLFAIKYPERVNRLVIANSYSEFPTQAAKWVLNLSNFIFSLLPEKTILKMIMNVYKNEPYTKQVIMDTYSIDKKMLLAMKTAPFPTHTHLLRKITAPTLVLSGAGKVVTGIDEGKGARTIFANLQSQATMALFEKAFDPLTTMRREIFNSMVLDFLAGLPLKIYPGVTYESK